MQNMILRTRFIEHYYYEWAQYVSLNLYKRIYASRLLLLLLLFIYLFDLAFV